MLTTIDIHMNSPEATPVAAAAPYGQTLADERRSGFVPALAERCVR